MQILGRNFFIVNWFRPKATTFNKFNKIATKKNIGKNELAYFRYRTVRQFSRLKIGCCFFVSLFFLRPKVGMCSIGPEFLDV